MRAFNFMKVTTFYWVTISIVDFSTNILALSSSGLPVVSSDPWRLVEIKFKNQNIDTSDLLSDFLLELGACSTSIVDHDKDTEEENPIFLAESWGVTKKLWQNSDVTAHFPASSFDAQSIAESVRVAFELSASPRFEVEGVEDKDWVIHVQESWKPCVVAGFLLRFPWHDDRAVTEAIEDQNLYPSIPKERHLKLQGGMAFGTGEHPTTRLCLEFITDTVQKMKVDNDGKESIKYNFLDYGAGSGVLGIAACKAGGQNFKATGIEIDADAVQIANVNAKENGVPMVSFLPKLDRTRLDDESLSVTLRGRSQAEVLPDSLEGPVFDACAANILAAPLCMLAPVIASHLKPAAPLGLSGILNHQGDDVLSAYKPFFDRCEVSKEEEGWLLITGIRNDYNL